MARKNVDRTSTERPRSDAELRVWVQLCGAIGRIADKFGVAFAVMVVFLATVWWMGSEQTQDDFIRELLFGSVTGTRALAWFLVALAVIAIFGLDTKFRSLRTERREMKRLAAERDRWQELALNRPLSHTDGEAQ